MWAQLPHQKWAQQPPIFGPCLLWPNDWMDRDATWYRGRPRAVGPGDIVFHGNPASPLQKRKRGMHTYFQRSKIGCLPLYFQWCGLSANIECTSDMCCTRLAKNTGRKKSPSGHHRTTLSGDIFATNISNISSTCPHNMVNFGSLAAEIGPVVWGTSANFNGFHVLAALLHGTPVLGVSQTLRRWTEGATYIRQGGHHVGHWPTFSLLYCCSRVPFGV